MTFSVKLFILAFLFCLWQYNPNYHNHHVTALGTSYKGVETKKRSTTPGMGVKTSLKSKWSDDDGTSNNNNNDEVIPLPKKRIGGSFDQNDKKLYHRFHAARIGNNERPRTDNDTSYHTFLKNRSGVVDCSSSMDSCSSLYSSSNSSSSGRSSSMDSSSIESVHSLSPRCSSMDSTCSMESSSSMDSLFEERSDDYHYDDYSTKPHTKNKAQCEARIGEFHTPGVFQPMNIRPRRFFNKLLLSTTTILVAHLWFCCCFFYGMYSIECTFRNEMNRTKQYQNVPKRTKTYQNVPKRTKTYQNEPSRLGGTVTNRCLGVEGRLLGCW
ncbi:hypothetical protein PCOAH_00012760 [Plasmodium coatneyi]|uniref:Uncharacterized protein n=1 Tax=Plasmodium coatneyi TaxID=208452 RepID=A0A1B1DX02_9APIC|nr:hypothetical protein PCOAH_00012760 [Plasmodium coatneyi]ANQ07115.1 hypothetical protein PCOAH_00012760 [Plasmodium coatneyi]